ncbi:MAG TPA: FHA domain-containing protein [Polyangiaceae bacterium]|nr:FHA domain-containing protein [Polyangiaceae bacterium]
MVIARAARSTPSVALLRFRGRERCLAPGEYLIGRAPTSDIVVSSARASRTHARLQVNEERVSIEDLGSANGVFVNGRRIAGECGLAAGDRVSIGDDELEFRDVGAPSPELERTLVGSQSQPLVPTPPDHVVISGTYPTARSQEPEHSGFALVGTMAERALLSQRPQDAVNILRHRLLSVLEDARRGDRVAPGMRQAALEYACKLALATRDGKWIEYVLDLLTSLVLPCPESVSDAFAHAARSVNAFDRGSLERYIRSMRALPPSLDRIRATQQAEALLGQLTR